VAAELVTEQWEGIRKKSSVVAEPTLEAVAAAIRALDGRVYTMVSIVFKASSVIFIGGGGSNGLYVVTATHDGEHFKIAIGDASSTGMVTITAGGQEGDYPARHCVDLVTALRAARAFASTGEMDSTVNWEDDQ
jgi:Immunity protein Imm1